jgi:hypothetical protein
LELADKIFLGLPGGGPLELTGGVFLELSAGKTLVPVTVLETVSDDTSRVYHQQNRFDW